MNATQLLEKIRITPTAWHAAANLSAELDGNGFTRCFESDMFTPASGNYYWVRGGTALIAVKIPTDFDPDRASFRIASAHSDSPALRLKPNPTLPGATSRWNVEVYGGGILSTWLDRPLTLAGRLSVRDGKGLHTELIHVNRPIAVIPYTPPHLRPNVAGMDSRTEVDARTDLYPTFGTDGDLFSLLEAETGWKKESVVGYDLCLTAAEKGFTFGSRGELISSPRLDDLECVFTLAEGFLSAGGTENTVSVLAIFDNEETGSLSYCGAMGTALADALARIIPDPTRRNAALARSFFVSADNAHALHPNRPELNDSHNAPTVNGGVVVKYNASQRYLSDGFSGAVFAEICRNAGVPVQVYANRTDQRGGSTLGNLSQSQVPVHGVDIGAAQWSMHSAVETAGSDDVEFLSRAANAYYSAAFDLRGEDLVLR